MRALMVYESVTVRVEDCCCSNLRSKKRLQVRTESQYHLLIEFGANVLELHRQKDRVVEVLESKLEGAWCVINCVVCVISVR